MYFEFGRKIYCMILSFEFGVSGSMSRVSIIDFYIFVNTAVVY
jgi:hypothetical protein